MCFYASLLGGYCIHSLAWTLANVLHCAVCQNRGLVGTDSLREISKTTSFSGGSRSHGLIRSAMVNFPRTFCLVHPKLEAGCLFYSRLSCILVLICLICQV